MRAPVAGAPLPDDLFQKLCRAKTFRAASQMLRQLHFASLDLELHSQFQPGGPETIFDVDRRVAARALSSLNPKQPYPKQSKP